MTDFFNRLSKILALREHSKEWSMALVAVLAAGGLAYVLVLEPAAKRHKLLSRDVEAQRVKLEQLTKNVADASKLPTAKDDASAALQQLQSQLDAVNQEILDLQGPASTPADLQRVLDHLLSRQQGLTLHSMRSLGSTAKSTSSNGKTSTAKPSAAAPSATGVKRTTFELKVSGPYLALVQYLRAIESTLPDLRWDSLLLKGGGAQPMLTVQVYLVEV